MKTVAQSLIVAVVSASDADTATPIAHILSLLNECEAKVIKEGEEAQKTYSEFERWCDERHANLQYGLKTSSGEAEGSQATVGKEVANQQVLSSVIDDTAADIFTDEKDFVSICNDGFGLYERY